MQSIRAPTRVQLKYLLLTEYRHAECEREGIVGGDEAPVGGIAQVVSHGVKVVGVHGEEGQEKDEEVRGEVKGRCRETQRETLIMDGM